MYTKSYISKKKRIIYFRLLFTNNIRIIRSHTQIVAARYLYLLTDLLRVTRRVVDHNKLDVDTSILIYRGILCSIIIIYRILYFASDVYRFYPFEWSFFTPQIIRIIECSAYYNQLQSARV